MIYGVNLNINVSKINKEKIYEGKKGKYINLYVYLEPDNPDQYGRHGAIIEEQTKEERLANKMLIAEGKPSNKNILGNAKVVWRPSAEEAVKKDEAARKGIQDVKQTLGIKESNPFPEDDIPF